MGARFAIWGIRFVIAAALYAAMASFWVDQATGWNSLGRFATAIASGMLATPAWCAAIAIGHCLIRNEYVRLIAHPPLTLAVFAIVVLIAVVGFTGDRLETVWRDVKPLIPFIALATFADAIVGFLAERRLLASTGTAS